jgi:hypothetical protein
MRKWIALFDSQLLGGDEYAYHATFVSNLDDIRDHGLTPNTDREPNFDGFPVQGKLFVSTEDGAEFYADELAAAYDKPMALLRFRVPEGIVADPYGNPHDGYVEETIPASEIEVNSDGQWRPLNA